MTKPGGTRCPRPTRRHRDAPLPPSRPGSAAPAPARAPQCTACDSLLPQLRCRGYRQKVCTILSWETEAWIANQPTQSIYFSGRDFLGHPMVCCSMPPPETLHRFSGSMTDIGRRNRACGARPGLGECNTFDCTVEEHREIRFLFWPTGNYYPFHRFLGRSRLAGSLYSSQQNLNTFELRLIIDQTVLLAVARQIDDKRTIGANAVGCPRQVAVFKRSPR